MEIDRKRSLIAGPHRLIRFVLALLLWPIAFGVQARSSEAGAADVVTPHLRASLVSERASIEPGHSFWVALRFDIIAGWHTYWRNAGDSGNPPRIEWSLPEGFSASDIHWPYPQRLPVGPLMNYGYSDEAWMLVRITAPDSLEAGQSVALRAHANWLVCKVECIPEEGQFNISLPVVGAGRSVPSSWSGRFEAIRQRLPQPAPWPSRFNVTPGDLQLQFDFSGLDTGRLQDVYLFPASYGIVEHAARQTHTVTERDLVLNAVRGDLRGQPLQRLQGVLLLTEQLPDGAITRAFSIDAVRASAASSHSLPLILSFALLGGLLLNIMPCVFPILSLKALSMVQGAAQSHRTVRRNGYAFTFGVLVSFGVIALVLLALRAGGEAIGWGFQLQSPVFVLLLAWLIFATGLMFSGFWSFGERWMGAGQQLTTRQGSLGAFFTGVLGVIVATPCTAPFMGTATGYALSQPAGIAVSVFMVLGLGMALPWLSISLWPGLSAWLPRPGAWMERVKQLLAFPLYATVAWLLWVFSQQTDERSLLYALVSLVVIAFVLWLWQNARDARTAWRTTAGMTITALAIVLGGGLLRIESVATIPTTAQRDWEQYDAARLAQLRREGRPVLVNFTAAWCITCLVNERVALSSAEVKANLKERNIAYMKGDWTSRDPVITRVLMQYGRSGVPLYLLFPKDQQREAIMLPNILTEGVVVDALRQLE